MNFEYFGCTSCWRVYSKERLLAEDSAGCACGSWKFRGIMNPNSVILQRLFTDFKYTIKTWIRERLSHE